MSTIDPDIAIPASFEAIQGVAQSEAGGLVSWPHTDEEMFLAPEVAQNICKAADRSGVTEIEAVIAGGPDKFLRLVNAANHVSDEVFEPEAPGLAP